MPLRLHAVVPNNGHSTPSVEPTEDGNSFVSYRELGAVVSETPEFRSEALGEADLARHRTAIDAAFRRGPVLPAPLGIVFRNPDVLVRWMELHYVVLQDALGFLEDRVAARVHAAPSGAGGARESLSEGAGEVAARASETFQALRRAAVSSAPLDPAPQSGTIASAAFLLERAQWSSFESAVAEQREAHTDLRLEVSGPWPPYDFVRMRFQTGEET